MAAPRAIPQRREYLADPQLARVDQAREDLATTLGACPFLRGRLVSVTFASGVAKTVRHGLGVAAACFPIRMNYALAATAVRFFEGTQGTTDQKQSLVLVADATCTVDMWFYPRTSKAVDAGQGQSK